MPVVYAQRRRPTMGSPYTRYPKVQKRARSVVARGFPMRRVERKRAYFGLLNIQPASASIHMYNPLYYITPGTGRDQRIGNQVSRATLHYSFRLCALALTALAEGIDQSAFIRVVVFTHSKEWNSNSVSQWALNTAGAGTTINASELLKDSGSDRHCQSYLNIDEIRVLHDRVIQLEREQTGPGTVLALPRSSRAWCRLVIFDSRTVLMRTCAVITSMSPSSQVLGPVTP